MLNEHLLKFYVEPLIKYLIVSHDVSMLSQKRTMMVEKILAILMERTVYTV